MINLLYILACSTVKNNYLLGLIFKSFFIVFVKFNISIKDSHKFFTFLLYIRINVYYITNLNIILVSLNIRLKRKLLAFSYDFEGYDRTVDTHIKNLRQKIEDNVKGPKYIITVYGVGYKFEGE